MIERIELVCPVCDRRVRISRGAFEDYSGISSPDYLCIGEPEGSHLPAAMVPAWDERYYVPENQSIIHPGRQTLRRARDRQRRLRP